MASFKTYLFVILLAIILMVGTASAVAFHKNASDGDTKIVSGKVVDIDIHYITVNAPMVASVENQRIAYMIVLDSGEWLIISNWPEYGDAFAEDGLVQQIKFFHNQDLHFAYKMKTPWDGQWNLVQVEEVKELG